MKDTVIIWGYRSIHFSNIEGALCDKEEDDIILTENKKE